MNLKRLRRWDSRHLRRGLGSFLLLTVLALCLLSLSRGGRAQPPPQRTVGDLVTPTPAATSSVTAPPFVSSPAPSPAPQAPPTSKTPAWNPEAQGETSNSSIFVQKLQQMVIVLFLVGFLAYASLRMVARWLPGVGPGKRLRQLEVLERQSLAQGASISLVRVGKKYLVVGQTEQNVNTLCELGSDQLALPEPKAECESNAEASVQPAMPAPHGEILRHYLSIIPGLGARK
ncbi:hypothetical protein DYH09_06905 [bacterium CPR1]|nr:hypothetical protein [bacterium CPR1]